MCIFARRLCILAAVGIVLCSVALVSTVMAAASAVVRVETLDKKSSAKVLVDGQESGRTPVQLQLTPGQHELEIVWNSGARAKRTLTLMSGDRRTLQLAASQPALAASLEITVDDQAASISLDGTKIGTGSVRIKLAPGPHDIAVVFSDGTVASRAIDVAPGARMTLSPQP